MPDRKYYVGPNVFTKTFIFGRSNNGTWGRFCSEVYAIQHLSGEHFCRFVGRLEIRGALGLITMERIGGANAYAADHSDRNTIDLEGVARQVLEILEFFPTRRALLE